MAITNLGGMRADLPAGDVTIADVVAVMPFDNVLIEVELSGAQLVEVLELGPAAVGGVSQYRSRWRLDESGAWVDPEATYSVLVNDFMYAGGDDYGLLAEFDPEGYDTSINWRQPVIDWLEFEAQQAGESIVDIASPAC